MRPWATYPLREPPPQVRAAVEVLTDITARLRRRGLRHPYLKNFVLARTTPLTRARKTLPSFETRFERLTENLERFDVTGIRYEDVARSALMAGFPGGT